ncbi:Hint domain-containing protein [Fluviispira multicolorata]|uniref:Hint domain-containing protein n=1 Tax=Fluviispira multicolorata TaxID=2654512 RepID=A0A833JE83_9BACT|nr:Hint domain-containing protein [Fluviispira multicolorata]KAB8032268.1 hypothetical protein GCL57_06360 [Fluviispira multicolorata]
MLNKVFSMNFFKSLIFCFSLLLTIQTFAAPPGNRIDKASGNGRCLPGFVPEESYCKKERDYALQIGCINQDEFNSLVRLNSFPTCDRFDNLVSVFKTNNNLRLAVTSEHAILLADGRMIAAKNVKLTDQLVLANGNPIGIKSIESLKTNKNVLNVLTTGNSNIEHTVFAEGLIVGDLAWQNNLQKQLNAIAIRK